MNNLILYATKNVHSKIKLRAKGKPVGLTHWDMAGMFNATKPTISLHLKKLFEERDIDQAAIVKESLTVHIGFNREVQCPINLYSLDTLLARGLPGAFAG